jgi:hypothetical protein
MTRFVCIRAEVEKRRAEVVVMGGNDKIRILDVGKLRCVTSASVPHHPAPKVVPGVLSGCGLLVETAIFFSSYRSRYPSHHLLIVNIWYNEQVAERKVSQPVLS